MKTKLNKINLTLIVLMVVLALSCIFLVGCQDNDKELVSSKTTAKFALENFVNAGDYRDMQQQELIIVLANGKKAIDKAIDIVNVEKALTEAKENISRIKTDAQLNEDFNNAKIAAITIIENYVDSANYRSEQKKDIDTTILYLKVAIGKAMDIDEVNKAIEKAKLILNLVKTNAQLEAEELYISNAIAVAQVEFNEFAKTFNIANYRDAEKNKIAIAITNGKTAIANATIADDIVTALERAKTSLNLIKTDAQLTEAEQALTTAKNIAISTLDEYGLATDTNEYTPEQKLMIKNEIGKGKTAIGKAASVSSVNSALTKAQLALSAIKTESQINSENQAIKDAKISAKNELDELASGINLNDYRDKQKEEFLTAITSGKTAIDNATSIKAISTALATAKNKIANIKTNAQLSEAENILLEAKNTAKITLQEFFNLIDLNKYRDLQVEELNLILANGKNSIANASSSFYVSNALTTAKNKLDTIKTNAQIIAGETVIGLELDTKNVQKSYIVGLNSQLNFDNLIIYKVMADDTRIAISINDVKISTNLDSSLKGDYEVTVILAGERTFVSIYDITVTQMLTTTLKDDSAIKGSKYTFNVFAKYVNGSKVEANKVSVSNNGTKVSVSLDDNEKTSYMLLLNDGLNNIVISYSDENNQTIEARYTLNHPHVNIGDEIGAITFSIDAFSIGYGYLVEPVKIKIHEGEQLSFILDRVIRANGLNYTNGGELASGFYLSAITGLDMSNYITDKNYIFNTMPKNIQSLLQDNGQDISGVITTNSLGEFDFTNASGWQYSVNNRFPGMGLSDYYPMDGEAVRVQFTTIYGGDIGGGWSGAFFEDVTRDELTAKIAEINISGQQKKYGKSYTEAVAVLAKFGITQRDLNVALKNLNKN